MNETPEIARIREALETLREEYVKSAYSANELTESCNPAAMTAVLAHIDAQAAEIAALRADAARLEFYSKNEHKILKVGGYWYSRSDHGMPLLRRSSFRNAIDEAMKEQP